MMLVRVCVFIALVAGLAGVTASFGLVVTESASACQVYKTC